MRNYTTLPRPNQAMALRHITDHAEDYHPDAGFWKRCGALNREGYFNSTALNAIIRSFMQKHPRGKGTAGDRGKREFYAACYAIQSERSRNWRQKNSDRVPSTLTISEIDVLLAFEGAEPLRNPKLNKRGLTSLENKDYIDGFYIEHGNGFKPLELWLTDRGLQARKVAVALRRRADADKITKGASNWSAAQGWTTTIDIDGQEAAITINRASKEEAEKLCDKILVALKQNLY